MPWESHLSGGNHLGQVDPGTAAEAVPQDPTETPSGTPIRPQPASFSLFGQKELILTLVAAAVTWLILSRLKK